MADMVTVPKWVLIVWPKIPQMPQNLFVQFVCLYPKVLDFTEKKTSLGVRTRSNGKICGFMWYLKLKYHFSF